MISKIIPKKIRLGILTPSANTVLEPITNAILETINSTLPEYQISAHFSRFPVTQISLDAAGIAQFEVEHILAAAELLTHAGVDIIGWSGTSATWLGFDNDEELCRAIEERTGTRATTSIIALNKALKIWNVQKLGLVTPYRADVQERIVCNYQSLGVKVREERHLSIDRNQDIAEVDELMLDRMVGEVVWGGVNAVTTCCTNLPAARRVCYWEESYGVPVFDTVTTVVWDMLRTCAVDVKGVRGWGMLFQTDLGC